MRTTRDWWAAAAVVVTVAAASSAAEPKGTRAAPLAVPGLRNDQPITVTSRTLEYDYKQNVVVYRGDVRAEQGDVHLTSDELTIHLASAETPAEKPATDAAGERAAGEGTLGGRVQLREIVATGNVRIDQGERWATGGRAVFDQTKRILLLTGDPVLHDGPNQIAGDRVVVYLDEDRSVVEGGQKRVKAVLFPGRDETREPR
jgi:lipopolysaccharide export system protein LptA